MTCHHRKSTNGGRAYELVHCALVLEYVDPDVVLAKIARWLSPNGVLVVVLQLHSPEAKAVTETGYDSLKLLEPLMKLHEPDDIRQRAIAVGLLESASQIECLESGKQFYIGHFRFDEGQQVNRQRLSFGWPWNPDSQLTRNGG